MIGLGHRSSRFSTDSQLRVALQEGERMWFDAREESEAWKPKVLWEETLMDTVNDAAIAVWVRDRRRTLVEKWKMRSKIFLKIVLIIFIDSETRATVCHQWDIPTGHARVNGSTAKQCASKNTGKRK
jgi:hypothetical protein